MIKDTPMLREEYRAYKANAAYFGMKNADFDCAVKSVMDDLQDAPTPSNYVKSARIVLEELVRIDELEWLRHQEAS